MGKPSLLEIAQAVGMNRHDVAKLVNKGLVVEGDFTNSLELVAISSLAGDTGNVTREFFRPELALTDEGSFTVFRKVRR